MDKITTANLAARLKLTLDELANITKEQFNELCGKLPWIASYLNKFPSDGIKVASQDVILAKVGLAALIDEATGYQEVRKPDALVEIAKELSVNDQVKLAVAEADSPDTVWHEHDTMFDELELKAKELSDEPKVTETPVTQAPPLTKKDKRKYNFKSKEGATK